MDLGVFSAAVRKEGSSVVPVMAGDVDVGSMLTEVLNQTETVESTLANYVGPPVWASLHPIVREHLVTALTRLSHNSPPDEVVRSVGWPSTLTYRT